MTRVRTPTEAAARLRGAFVGSASGAVSIAAHALAGGTVSPGRSALALLLAACTLTGAVVASMRTRHGVVEVMAMLAIGQTVGHLALSMSAGHHHSTHTGGAMLMAHLITIPVGGLLIHSAQRAITGAASSAVRAVGVLGTGPLAPRTPALAVSFSAAQTRSGCCSVRESAPGDLRRPAGPSRRQSMRSCIQRHRHIRSTSVMGCQPQ